MARKQVIFIAYNLLITETNTRIYNKTNKTKTTQHGNESRKYPSTIRRM
jgi:hypothetical protein